MKQKVKTKLPRNFRQPKKELKIYDNIVFHKLDWLEWCTIILGLMFLLRPDLLGYRFTFSILVITPILGLILNGINRPSIVSLIDIDLKNDRYDVADFIDWAAWCIAFRVMIDFNIDSISYLIIPGIIAAISILVLLFFTHRIIVGLKKNRSWIYLSIIFNLVVYSYAATYGINCIYDNSTPIKYSSRIIKKYIKSGRNVDSYFVKFTAWDDPTDLKEIRISEQAYNSSKIGDQIEIDRMKGFFGIPWWYMNEIKNE